MINNEKDPRREDTEEDETLCGHKNKRQKTQETTEVGQQSDLESSTDVESVIAYLKDQIESEILTLPNEASSVSTVPETGDKSKASLVSSANSLKYKLNIHTCPFCQKRFVLANFLDRHISTEHPDSPLASANKRATKKSPSSKPPKESPSPPTPPPPSQPSKGRPHKCPHCAEYFPSPKHVRLHIIIADHNPVKSFTCGNCGEAFAEECNFVRHLRNTHNAGDTLTCQACDLTFTDANVNKKHLLEYHRQTPLKMIPPPILFPKDPEASSNDLTWNQTVSESSASASPTKPTFNLRAVKEKLSVRLSNPVASPTVKEEPRKMIINLLAPIAGLKSGPITPTLTPSGTFRCPICTAEYTSTINWMIHLQKHNKKGDCSHPFACLVCAKNCTSNQELARHLADCLVVPPQLILNVPPAPSPKYVLAPNVISQPVLSKGILPKVPEPKPKAPKPPTQWHVCTHCKVQYTSQSRLQQHLIQYHPRTTKKVTILVQCVKCLCAFDNVRTLQQHMLKYHANQVTQQQPVEEEVICLD